MAPLFNVTEGPFSTTEPLPMFSRCSTIINNFSDWIRLRMCISGLSDDEKRRPTFIFWGGKYSYLGGFGYEDDDHHDSAYFRPIKAASPSQLITASSTTPASVAVSEGWSTDEVLRFIAYRLLLPVVIVLVAICLVLGITLIVKSYTMKPLKQNLATAIRRRRRLGHAPDNQYIGQDEIRDSIRISRSDERKSMPPPEVILAARERASQIYHI